jgi:hypothetical protein
MKRTSAPAPLAALALAFAGCSGGAETLGGEVSAPETAEDAAMPVSISPDLATDFRRHEGEDGHVRQVVITLDDAGAADAVEALEGVEVVNRMNNAPILVARIDAAGLKALSTSPAVKRVEPDGEMRALD